MRTCLVVVALGLIACGPAPAPAPPQGPSGKVEHRMANCPSAVVGATTGSLAIDGGVVLDVTATDPAAAREIAELAHRHAAMGPPDPSRGLHTGRHGGPGGIEAGHCPVIHVGTTITVTDIAGGVRITVLATDPAMAAELQRETRERIQWLDPSMRAP